jgi:hypothetical protein
VLQEIGILYHALNECRCHESDLGAVYLGSLAVYERMNDNDLNDHHPHFVDSLYTHTHVHSAAGNDTMHEGIPLGPSCLKSSGIPHREHGRLLDTSCLMNLHRLGPMVMSVSIIEVVPSPSLPA